MKKYFLIILMLILGTSSCKKENPRILIETSMGDITVELFANEAPGTVKNFLSYADRGFYDGTIFHRVIENFMIQGGGLTSEMMEKETGAPIKNEADNGLSNKRGTLAMARTHEIHSATSQFFINVADNPFLDHGKRDFGYCVFGRVIGGMNVVDAIRMTPVQTVGFHQNVPVEHITIISIKRIEKK